MSLRRIGTLQRKNELRESVPHIGLYTHIMSPVHRFFETEGDLSDCKRGGRIENSEWRRKCRRRTAFDFCGRRRLFWCWKNVENISMPIGSETQNYLTPLWIGPRGATIGAPYRVQDMLACVQPVIIFSCTQARISSLIIFSWHDWWHHCLRYPVITREYELREPIPYMPMLADVIVYILLHYHMSFTFGTSLHQICSEY